jgi:hypothetical protein
VPFSAIDVQLITRPRHRGPGASDGQNDRGLRPRDSGKIGDAEIDKILLVCVSSAKGSTLVLDI